MQSTVSGLEAMLGEFQARTKHGGSVPVGSGGQRSVNGWWQVAAVKAGLLFTPQQLEEADRTAGGLPRA